MNVHYNPQLKTLARQLRNNMTQAEVVLWKRLKGQQFIGYDFHRQKPIGNFIADFYCYPVRLVIEVDGYSHQFEETVERDHAKEDFLHTLGFSVLRFSDNEVVQNLPAVLQVIENYILNYQEQHACQTPTPP